MHITTISKWFLLRLLLLADIQMFRQYRALYNTRAMLLQ